MVAQPVDLLTSVSVADIRGERARRRLIPFAQHTHPRYKPASHHQLIAEKLEAVERGEIDRLMIFMPPRHGKSELASIRFPAWYIGRNPDKRIIGTSYGADLAYAFSRQARAILRDTTWPFPGVKLSTDAQAVKEWNIEGRQGGYVAAGVGGPISGKGAHLLLIDDPIKNPEEADSEAYRNGIWEWYQQAAYTRLEDSGAIVLIMTRWHHDDLAGRLIDEMKKGGDQWDILELPALDVDGRALWPEKYDEAALQRIRAAVGSRAWTALYQQQPTDEEGALFKREWWQYYDDLPHFDEIIQLWDTAFKAKTTADYSVCSTWGRCASGYYLIDLWRGQVEFPDLKRMAVLKFEKFRPNAVVIEDAASGQSLMQELGRETLMPVVAFKVDRDKVARANAVTATVEAQLCYLPRNAPWLGDFIEEHAQFPNGAHDDQVDTTTMALLRFQQHPALMTAVVG